jgi:ATP-dependent DNA helicase RecG
MTTSDFHDDISTDRADRDALERAVEALRNEWRNGFNGHTVRQRVLPAVNELRRYAASVQAEELVVALVKQINGYPHLNKDERKQLVLDVAAELEALRPHLRMPGMASQELGKLNQAVSTGRARPTGAVTASTTPKPPRPGRGLVPLLPDAPVTAIPNIAESRAKLLEKVGILTVGDLVRYAPRDYIDYSNTIRIGEAVVLRPGQLVTIKGTITKLDVLRGPKLQRVEARLDDGTGWIKLVWFNGQHIARALGPGAEIVVSGEIEAGYGRPSITAPEWEWAATAGLSTGGLIPVYPLTKGLFQKTLRGWTRYALDATRQTLGDFLPEALLAQREMPALHRAYEAVHFPTNQRELQRARERLAFGEMLLLQIGLTRKRKARQSTGAYPFTFDAEMIDRFEERLPFRFTNAQRRVIDEITADLRLEHPMARLLQGDVGAGKTAVAAAAAWLALRNGLQSVVLAPTEILAEQHAAGLTRIFDAFPESERPSVRLLTGSTKANDRRLLLADLIEGDINLLVGTHAVIEKDVQFRNLGLTVIDEQHRFGVRQRSVLPNRGRDIEPHVLSMTATPIPRTLNAVVHGDLDVSIIDELPPGRVPIETRLYPGNQREEAYQLIRAQIEQGRQAFVICPLVEESDVIDARAAVAEAERLQTEVFPDLRVDVLHGRMKGKEKDAIMSRFRDRGADILVATSVIEVGIDIPNATVILIEGADRFGLAQLHQLRGRVGRGADQSWCLLLTDDPSMQGKARLELMTRTNDGFELAAEDLKLRGPGDFLGTRQSGLPETPWLAGGFDSRLLDEARQAAEAILLDDEELMRPEHEQLRARFEAFWSERGTTQAA